MNTAPKALILNAPGINCNNETAYAFDISGASPEQVHINELTANAKYINNYDILALPGGFSYGDSIRSGAVLGTILSTRFNEDLLEFVDSGKPVLGICNGFQILTETGILPGSIETKQASLIHNKRGKFECRWTTLKLGETACTFVKDPYPDNPDFGLTSDIQLPVAHGEGRFVETPGAEIPEDQITYTYTFHGFDSIATTHYPDNPNGSPRAIAGITNKAGNVLGMMPHPERFIRDIQHPNWRSQKVTPYGAELFKQIVQYAKES